ncbi:MAG: SEC-C metal-binding domain-containing protein, partial [Polyangiaceae bacterium]
GDRVKNLMERMGMPDDEPIEHPWVTKSVENAQKKVEERNFDIRKNLLEYDDVMSAQRKTIYEMRQQMLLGRYAPEVVDEEGKPTGERRKIKSDPSVAETVAPEVALRLGLFCEDPVTPRDDDGRRRHPSRADFEKASGTGGGTGGGGGGGGGAKAKKKSDKAEAGSAKKNKLVDTEQMIREFYEQWGVKLDVTGREEKVLEIYDEAVEMVPKALTEQRERALDLIDRLIRAMVEESCPPRKPPEDWDWGGIFQGFKEHFGMDLGDEITENVDAELLAQDLFKRAEQAYKQREKKLGIELTLRLFRHVYLEELDKAWVDHLTDMDHLRDGIGLRGYGQRDPKNEYKKEGYNMFVNMVARVSSNVITKLFSTKVRGVEEEEALEAADAERHARQLASAVAQHADAAPVVSQGAAAVSEPPPPPAPPPEPAVKADMACPCGSGKPFATCHGAEDEATV